MSTRTSPTLPGQWATTAVPLFGHLSWVSWFWFGGGLVFAGALVVAGMFGRLDGSFWQGVTTVLAWSIFAAGVTTVPSYGPIFVANGMTRARLSRSGVVALAIVGSATVLVAMLGYAIEIVVFDAQGWRHATDAGAAIEGFVSLPRLAIGYLAALSCYAASGWLVGVLYMRLSITPFLLSLVPAAVPIVVSWLMLDSTGSVGSLSVGTPLVVGVVVTGMMAAGTMLIAARLARDVVFEP